MNTDPIFVVKIAGAGGYFSTGYPLSHHKSRGDAEAALAKLDNNKGNCRVEDWTLTLAQIEHWRATQE